MDQKHFPQILAFFSVLLIMCTAAFAASDFSVDEPDGTADSTSGYFTIQWTPADDFESEHHMVPDVNTISCYGDSTSAGYDKEYTVLSNYPCCSPADDNQFTTFVGDWAGRRDNATYYIWCINDQNTDMNAYSAGTLTVTAFVGGDFDDLAFQTVGALLRGIAVNIGAIATIIVIAIIVIILLDVLFGVFGIFKFFRDMAGNR